MGSNKYLWLAALALGCGGAPAQPDAPTAPLDDALVSPARVIGFPGFAACLTPQAWLHADGSAEDLSNFAGGVEVASRAPGFASPAPAGLCGAGQIGVLMLEQGSSTVDAFF